MRKNSVENHAIKIRRDLHRRPEPAWCEFYTTGRILEELQRIGVNDVISGPDAIHPGYRTKVPDPKELERWRSRAEQAGIDSETLERMEDGFTGCIAVLGNGDSPVIGLRVDIDALPVNEAEAPFHAPVRGGFRSLNTGYMHACGHDAHTAIGLGVLERLSIDDIDGTVKVYFQPSEEIADGARPIVERGHLDDVDYFFAIHVGLGYPTGTVISGFDRFLAVVQLEANFVGESTHAGTNPEGGANAIRSLSTAIEQLFAIPRHSGGATRINIGKVSGGSAPNIIPNMASFSGEVRGETTDLKDYMVERAEEIIRSAAELHGCQVTIEMAGNAPSAASDPELATIVESVATEVTDLDDVRSIQPFSASEDATLLMRRVQERNGMATYIGIGTDHPGGHHTPIFDVDERSIHLGIEVVTGTIERLTVDQDSP